ncbi:glycoside hydrolase family 15 protein [Mangrovibrevibacter kandeliae]|uniref:glycoside hydrolase family 15 protein n=1 Tax=Mangrovibrevibacter kandeliae TaxID=2968473 RepID=UPI002117CB94|nr:glycoside hydrolase family 15 protein [Aurantimonas sp. CSK15Z-1]
MTTKDIGDYAMIGDGETAALVGRDGTIEWLCMPDFDSEACFASLLGDRDNGCWRMAPVSEPTATSRRYRGDSLILETLFETESGTVAVIDFMPMRGVAPDVVRIVEGRSGRVAMSSELMLRFGYGRVHPLIRQEAETDLIAIAGPVGVVLRCDVPIEHGERQFDSRFTVAAGERVTFTLTCFTSYKEVPNRVDPAEALRQTEGFWADWAGPIGYDGEHRDSVVRSLVTLKGLIHRPTGGIVAAPTAALPEWPGGERNWDYRFCWLRDATFALLAFLQVGLRDEAHAWVRWLRRAVAGEPIMLQPFYTIRGERRVPEYEADWLEGFNGARPVRLGNAATGQLQLDVYGEVLDTLFFADKHGIERDGDSEALVRLLADNLEDLWEKPDAGIWESRGEPRHHTYSKVMCWTAFDRASRWFEESDPEASRRYRDLADRVKAVVLEKGFHADRNSFVRAFDDSALDAAALRLPLVGFLPADDPRVLGTVAAIETHLMRDGLVARYETGATDDGVGGDEGAFVAAGYWLANVYALQGRRGDAEALFHRLTESSNDVGLLSEELKFADRRLLGNFPQALSHLSLVNAALDLKPVDGPSREHCGQEG